MTQLDNAIGNATIIESKIIYGPRGGTKTELQKLGDGRLIFITPDIHGIFPAFLRKLIPNNHVIVRVGGTTFKWSGWITEPAKFKINYLYNKKNTQKLFRYENDAKQWRYTINEPFNRERFTEISEIIEIN